MPFRLPRRRSENLVLSDAPRPGRLQARWRTRYRCSVGREDEAAERDETGERPVAVRRSRWLAVVLLLFSLFGITSLFTGPGGFVRIRNLRAELAEVNDRNFDLVQSAHRLQSQIERLRVDDGEIERLARRHRLVRDGETLYQLGEDARRHERTTVVASEPAKPGRR